MTIGFEIPYTAFFFSEHQCFCVIHGTFLYLLLSKNVLFSVFPPGCTSFRGPHSMDCIQAIWLDTGCLNQGERSPRRLSRAEQDLLRNRNLR